MCLSLKTLFNSMFKKKLEKKWEFNPNTIVNVNTNIKTDYSIEVVCKLILNKILNITDVNLLIVDNDKLVKRFDTTDIEIQAFLQGYPILKKYVLYLRDGISKGMLFHIICHEMIHLKQYYDGKLRLDGTTFTWYGLKYNSKTPYWNRPWEIEARDKQYDIADKVKRLYYEQ